MKILNILLGVLGTALLAALGAEFLLLALKPALAPSLAGAQDFLGALPASLKLRWALGALGLLCLALVLAAFWFNLYLRRWERTIVLHNPHGEVLVSLAALEDIGRQAKADVPGIKDLKLRVQPKRRGLSATVRAVLFHDADVAKTSKAIQENVRRRLLKVIGEGQELRPRVLVSKVAFRGPEEGGLPELRIAGKPRPRKAA